MLAGEVWEGEGGKERKGRDERRAFQSSWRAHLAFGPWLRAFGLGRGLGCGLRLELGWVRSRGGNVQRESRLGSNVG